MNRDELETFALGNIMLIGNKIQSWLDQQTNGLTAKQVFLMIYIANIDIPNPTVKDIARFTGTSRQNTKKMLENLSSEGYVSLTPSKTDARALNVALTEKAFTYFAENDQEHSEIIKKLFEDVGDEELASLLTTVRKLYDKVEDSN